MGSTYKCNKCDVCFRVHSFEELEYYQREHNEKDGCNGKLESLWKNYNKIPKKKKEELMNKVLFRTGRLGKLKDLDTDMKMRAIKLEKKMVMDCEQIIPQIDEPDLKLMFQFLVEEEKIHEFLLNKILYQLNRIVPTTIPGFHETSPETDLDNNPISSSQIYV